MQNMKVLEALKNWALEVSRVALLAVVSYLATDFVIAKLVQDFFSSSMSPEMVLQVTGILTVILKAVDRSLHETKIAEKGLTQF